MATRGLNHINLRGPRELLERLKDFYCEVVGLTVGERPPFPDFGYWLYAGGHPIVHLYQAGPGEERHVDVPTTLDHVAFECEDSAAVEAVLKRRGLPFHKTTVPARRQTQLFVVDPGGTKVELNFPGEGQEPAPRT